MHLKKSLQGKSSERNFLNQGQCVALSYQTRFAYQQNDEVFWKISIIYNSCYSGDVVKFI